MNRIPVIWLVTVLAMGFLVQCGSDNTAEAAKCSFPVQDFVGGPTSFTVSENTIEDGCTNGLIVNVSKQYDHTYPGPYPQVNIPGYGVLKEGTSISTELPFVGQVAVDLSISDNMIELHVPVRTYVVGACTFAIEVVGQLTPCSAAKVDGGSFLVTVSGISGGALCGEGLVHTPCVILFSVTGS